MDERNNQVRIVIADDHALVLEGMLLLSEGNFDVIGKASNSEELLATQEVMTPDVYVIDVHMPKVDGLEASRMLLEKNPEARILFISGELSPHRIREALRLGGRGFISKDCSYQELASAIETVARGEKYVGNRVREALDQAGENELNLLTPRQVAVLQLIAEGMTAKEIASRLGLSPRTAEFHRQCIMERLNMHSTAELTRFALNTGLVQAGVYMHPVASQSAATSH